MATVRTKKVLNLAGAEAVMSVAEAFAREKTYRVVIANMPTPYSGSHAMYDPKPGNPPPCATMCSKRQSLVTRSPKPYPVSEACSTPFGRDAVR